MTIRSWFQAVSLVVGVVATRSPVCAQRLETETARLLPAHAWEFGGNMELQWSGDGRETAIPFSLIYGLTHRLELMAEPVAHTAIRPTLGRRATEVGDLEVTATYLLHAESAGLPGIALAGEVKFPTARDAVIGTQQTDVAGYLIASRGNGQTDLHFNVSYTHHGSPPGVPLRGTFGGAFAVVRHVTKRTDFFAEVLASSSASTLNNPEGSLTPEAAGTEVVGTLGVSRRFAAGLELAFSVSYDNNGAVLLRPGILYRIR